MVNARAATARLKTTNGSTTTATATLSDAVQWASVGWSACSRALIRLAVQMRGRTQSLERPLLLCTRRTKRLGRSGFLFSGECGERHVCETHLNPRAPWTSC